MYSSENIYDLDNKISSEIPQSIKCEFSLCTYRVNRMTFRVFHWNKKEWGHRMKKNYGIKKWRIKKVSDS